MIDHHTTRFDASHGTPSIRRADGSPARVIAVPAARQATPQDSAMPVVLGLGSYIVALPIMAVASCLVFASAMF